MRKPKKPRRPDAHIDVDPDVMAEIVKAAQAGDRTIKAEIRRTLRKAYLPETVAAE